MEAFPSEPFWIKKSWIRSFSFWTILDERTVGLEAIPSGTFYMREQRDLKQEEQQPFLSLSWPFFPLPAVLLICLHKIYFHSQNIWRDKYFSQKSFPPSLKINPPPIIKTCQFFSQIPPKEFRITSRIYDFIRWINVSLIRSKKTSLTPIFALADVSMKVQFPNCRDKLNP